MTMRLSWTAALAAGWLVLCGAAHAIDVPPPGSGENQHVIFDSTFDSTFFARSLDANLTFAPFGTVGDSGFRVRITASPSWYNFITDPELRTIGSGHSLEGNLLAGYGLSLPRVSIIVLAGTAIVESVDQGIRTERRGGKGVVSAYARPTDQMMAYGNFFFSTINGAYQAQMKTGWKVPGNFFLGPEVQFSGRDHNDQRRFGAHASGVAVGPVTLSFSGGFAQDRQMGSGYYASVNVYATF